MPKPNEGKIDRLLRLSIAIVIALGAFYKLTGTLQIVAYAVAVILFFNAISGFCLLYTLLKTDTIEHKAK